MEDAAVGRRGFWRSGWGRVLRVVVGVLLVMLGLGVFRGVFGDDAERLDLREVERQTEEGMTARLGVPVDVRCEGDDPEVELGAVTRCWLYEGDVEVPLRLVQDGDGDYELEGLDAAA